MNSGKYQFQKLTPTNSAKIEVYEEAIDFVFENQDIHNVAISGAYSAGKSSLIESYKAKHPDKKFVHLSLAHYIPDAETDQAACNMPQGSDQHGPTVKESVLEGKILNQLLHQIPAEKLPQTNFKVKKEISTWSIIWRTGLTAIFILSLLRIALRHEFANFATTLEPGCISNLVECLAQPVWIIWAAIICTAYTSWLIYKVIWLQKNRNLFKRINFHGNEIEIFEKQDESYFDKYLNEVLYLFENSGADVIVFEDMDRFNTSQIFERIHEINRLINVHRQKEDKNTKPLRFFYLLRDDMFISKDRTKFFDFIIPVVPVVDSSNSYDKFLEFFKKTEHIEKFEKGFLQSLSLYVDDMRILKNICNEFTVYINRINTIDLDYNKMLALIAYKNIFPRDFSDLQLGKGFVYQLFQEKNTLIEEGTKELQKHKEQLQQDICYLEKRVLISPRELKIVHDHEEDRYSRNYWNLSENERSKQSEYLSDIAKRTQRIESILNDDLDELAKELSDVEERIQHIKTSTLRELITRENIVVLFSATYTDEIGQNNDFHEIKSNHYFDLLKFLIRNGYIDETYSDYMSYFYEESISAHDKIFLRRITDRQGADYCYSLVAPEKVAACDVLRNVEFEQEETLNFDLLNYLLQNMDQPKFVEYVKVLMQQLKDTERFDFIAQYYDLNRSRQQFVIMLNANWNGFFQAALQHRKLTEDNIKQYSLDTLYCSKSETILLLNSDDCLSNYFSNTPEFLAIEDPDREKLINGFELLDVKIEQMTDSGVDNTLLDEVYQRNLYVLNADNIAFWLRREYGIKNEHDVLHQNFTLVSSRPKEPLYQNILKNLLTYVEVMLSICNDEICDAETAAASFLNFVNVKAESKTQYIDRLTTKICQLSEIEDTNLWQQLMEKGKIEFSAVNMLCFFNKFGLTDLLIQYINELPGNCAFSDIAKFNTEDRQKLFSEIVSCNDICDEKYKMVLSGMEFPFREYDANKIADSKLHILIQERLLQMDSETLRFIRSKYSDYSLEFIRYNFDAYLELQSEALADSDEVEEILSWDVQDKAKLHLLSFIDRSISIVGKTYSDEVNAYILEHHYDCDDFDNLCQNYSQYGLEAQKQILQKAVDQECYIYRVELILDDELLSQLLICEDINREHKIAFFVNSLSCMKEDDCRKHFIELELPELCGIFDPHGGGRNYVINDEITEIFEGLKQNEWIYDYHLDKRNEQKYVVVKNAPKQKR